MKTTSEELNGIAQMLRFIAKMHNIKDEHEVMLWEAIAKIQTIINESK